MTDRQELVLVALAGVCRVDPRRWWRPMDLGGHDQSFHSTVLAQLVRKKWAKRVLRGGHTRSAWGYRITALGRAAARSALR